MVGCFLFFLRCFPLCCLLLQELRHFGKAHAVAVVGGFLFAVAQHHNVGNGEGMSREILRVVNVETLINAFQRFNVMEGRGIDKLIVCSVNGQTFFFQPVKRFKAVIPCIVAAFELVNRKAVLRLLDCLRGFPLRLQLRKASLDLTDQLACRLADGFKGGFQLCDLLIAAPSGDIAKGVF